MKGRESRGGARHLKRCDNTVCLRVTELANILDSLGSAVICHAIPDTWGCEPLTYSTTTALALYVFTLIEKVVFTPLCLFVC